MSKILLQTHKRLLWKLKELIIHADHIHLLHVSHKLQGREVYLLGHIVHQHEGWLNLLLLSLQVFQFGFENFCFVEQPDQEAAILIDFFRFGENLVKLALTFESEFYVLVRHYENLLEDVNFIGV
jgi:hypothetical protein